MRSKLAFAVALSVAATTVALPALAQKQGGTLRIYHRDNLPSASVHPLRPHGDVLAAARASCTTTTAFTIIGDLKTCDRTNEK